MKSIAPEDKLNPVDVDKAIDAAQELGLEHSQWSILAVVDHMNAVATTGVKMLRYKEHWGHDKDLAIPIPPSPSWFDLAVAADRIIEMSGDTHHVFIENFRQDDDGNLWLETGS